jgi:hypothetical protein
MAYMLEDRNALFEHMARDSLLVPNTDTQMAGLSSCGYVSDLPGPDSLVAVTLKDLWGWAEYQESTIISPAMLKAFVLPCLADLLRLIMDAIPNPD